MSVIAHLHCFWHTWQYHRSLWRPFAFIAFAIACGQAKGDGAGKVSAAPCEMNEEPNQNHVYVLWAFPPLLSCPCLQRSARLSVDRKQRSTVASGTYSVHLGELARMRVTGLARVDRKELFGWTPSLSLRLVGPEGERGDVAIEVARTAFAPGFLTIYSPCDEMERPPWLVAEDMDAETGWEIAGRVRLRRGGWEALAGGFAAVREHVLGTPVGIGDVIRRVPGEFRLFQNYPNPFNPKTTIRYALPVTCHVEVNIYNLLGQKITTLVSENQPVGTHEVEWDASGMASGVYLYKLFTDRGYAQTKKLVLIK